MEKEAKKEAFRKYLESSGVVDFLTKGLVALYEQNDKPSSAIEFIQQKLGGPTILEYERVQAEKSDIQTKYDELLAAHQDKCREMYKDMAISINMEERWVLEELKKSHAAVSINAEPPQNDGRSVENIGAYS